MSKPSAHERVWPTKDISRYLLKSHTPASRLAELLVWDLRASGSDIPGGEYAGRTSAAVIAHGRSMFEHYSNTSKAGRPIVLEACAQAVNARLAELKHTVRIQANDLHDPDPTQPTREGWQPRGEPVALYMNRLKTLEEAKRYIDANPLDSYTAVDSFMADNPARADLRSAAPVVSYLAAHPGLDDERRILMAGAYSALVEQAALTPHGN